MRKLFDKRMLAPVALLAGGLAAGLLAWGSRVKVPGGPPVGEEEANAAWRRVLRSCVDGQGKVDFRLLAEDREDIETYLRWVATADEARMTEDERLAFHLNAYNALAMYGVARRGFPKDFDTLFDKIRFFYLPKYRVGGRRISLYDFEKDVIRPEADARVHQALNCMAAGCPILPREPFTKEDLQAELDRETGRFFAEERNVQTDDANRTVHLSELLKLYSEDYLADAPSLVSYVNRWREEPIPEGYRVEFIPYDWTVNR